MAQYSVNIFVATLVSAFFIGILGFLMGRIEGCPSEIFTFPAVLPMIPGIYAYETFLSVIKFLSENGEADAKSILDVLSLAIPQNSLCTLEATGPDAREAVAAVGTIFMQQD